LFTTVPENLKVVPFRWRGIWIPSNPSV